MLQLKDVLLTIRIIQLNARLLGGQTGFGRLLLADKCCARRRLCDANPGQPCFLEMFKKK